MNVKRRDFLTGASVGALGFGLNGFSKFPISKLNTQAIKTNEGIAKNIIFLVSDGMSSGTLQMADLLAQQKWGRHTHWMQAYLGQNVTRGLMDTASLNSYVTDSAAASSSWGGGHRVRNGRLNVGPNEQWYKPILQKFKDAGKAVGCVTSVPITHATPAGFCVNQKSRSSQAEIASQYMDLRFDVMLGGGTEFFSPETRSDQRDLFQLYRENDFHVAQTKEEMNAIKNDDKPVMGVFHESAIPYAIDHQADAELRQRVPTLAEMSFFAIQRMRNQPNGFVMQIEGGKVDWAAHANDTPALLYDQLAFDEAVAIALEFAENDGQTLVIITTDHGNANPGLIGTSRSIERFNRVLDFQHSHEWVFDQLNPRSTADEIKAKIEEAMAIEIENRHASELEALINQNDSETWSDSYKRPFAQMARILSEYTGIGYAGTDHSGDYVELSMYGPGSEALPALVKNTDLHNFMLTVTGCKQELVEVR